MIPVVMFIILLLFIFMLYISLPKKIEGFTQGYDAPISGCIKQCELELLRRNPYYVQLQEGGRMTQNYCRMICASEYNSQSSKSCMTGSQNGDTLRYSIRRNRCKK